MQICHSGRSAPSALALADALTELGEDSTAVRSGQGDINWGRNVANTELNADLSNATNKRVMRELFRDNGVPMPTYLTSTQAIGWVNMGKIIIGRPDIHSKGRGFWKCRTVQDVRLALSGTRRKRAATHFMEYIDAPREYRVHIFNGKSIRISEKSFGQTGTTTTGDYVTIRPQHEVSHVRQAAKDAVIAVGLDFGAVDVLANDTECWVLEVNSAPHLGGSLPRLYAENFVQGTSKAR